MKTSWDPANECCLILLADAEFTLISSLPIDSETKSDLVGKGFPKGSNWKLYAGARSLAFFSIEHSVSSFALSYSVITASRDVPVISFIILHDYYTMARILRRQLVGIQSAYFRRIDKFQGMSSTQTKILMENMLPLRTSTFKVAVFPFLTRRSYRKRYETSLQWRDEVENGVICSATRDLHKIHHFRTLSLQFESQYSVSGIVQHY